jgi:hypothetical protein
MITRRSTMTAATGAALLAPWGVFAQQEKLTLVNAHHTR